MTNISAIPLKQGSDDVLVRGRLQKNYFTPKSLPSLRLGSAMDFRADGKV